jgi:hypothetical protein
MSEKQYEVISQETPYKGFFRLEKFKVRHTLFNGGWTQPISREVFGAIIVSVSYCTIRSAKKLC